MIFRNTLFVILSGLFILISQGAIAANGSDDSATSDFLIFLGRFHPLIVHLPIGFLLIAFLMEIFSRIPRFSHLGQSVPFVLILGVISTLIAALLGYFLSLGGGYDEETLFWHKWLGVSVGVIALLAFVIKVKSYRFNLSRAYLPLFTVSVLALMITGHLGGVLTHGSDYLTQYMPDPLRAVAGLPPKEKKEKIVIKDINEALVFNHIIHPIFEEKCISCHNPKKLKGDLRLDTPEGILKGGEEGEVIITGNSEESRLFHFINLPSTDEDRMPPRGKKPLTDDEIALIGWWIDNGAPFDQKVPQLAINDDIKPKLDRLVAKSEDTFFSKKVASADPAVIQNLKKSGILAMQLGQDINYLNVNFINVADTLKLHHIELLVPIKEQVTWLDLRNKKSMTDDLVLPLKDFTNLTRLHLENTGITDKGVKELENLQELEYLNLYGTSITDRSIESLTKLKKLKRVFLWQTNISKDGVAELTEKRPDLEVNMGILAQDVQIIEGEKEKIIGVSSKTK
ncbi:ribonuclease inhibitor [soil metagenome]